MDKGVPLEAPLICMEKYVDKNFNYKENYIALMSIYAYDK